MNVALSKRCVRLSMEFPCNVYQSKTIPRVTSNVRSIDPLHLIAALNRNTSNYRVLINLVFSSSTLHMGLMRP